MSRAARLWSFVAVLAVAGALVGASPAVAGSVSVKVTDSAFVGPDGKPDTGDYVHFVLFDDAGRHSITSDTGLFDLEFTPDTPRTYADGPRSLVLSPLGKVGTYHYHCKYHGKPGVNGQVGTGMAATLVVKVPWKSTTTTTRPAGSGAANSTSTTTRQHTTAAVGPAASATQASTGAVPALSTPTSGPATSPSPRIDATRPSSTTAPTATSPAPTVPADAAPTEGLGKQSESTAATAEPETPTTEIPSETALDEAALEDGLAAEENSDGMLIVLGGLVAVLVLALAAGGGWAWYHRSSRYLPA